MSGIASVLRNLFHRARFERAMNDELQFHIQERAAHLVRSGLPEAQAFRRARLEFGGIESCKERCREARGGGWFDELARNLRYAFR
jgi:hypothetical protein